MKKAAALCTGLLLIVVFVAQAEAQGPPPKPIPVTEIDTGATSGLAATGTPFGNGVTGQVVGLFVPAGGITNSMLAGSINPTKITGTAAILGANSFTGNQSITGDLSVSGDTSTGTLHVNTNSAIGGNESISANLSVIGTASTGSHTITGNLSASGDATIGGNQSVTGNLGVSGNAGISGNLSVSHVIALPDTANSSTGVLTLGGVRFLHNYGTLNTFVGHGAGNFSVTGFGNTGIGLNALDSISTGVENIGIGNNTLARTTTAFQDISLGFESMFSNTTGSQNIAVGFEAFHGNTTGNGNIGIGLLVGDTTTTTPNGSENIYIGEIHGAVLGGENGTIRIGNHDDCNNHYCQDRAFMAGISGVQVAGDAVYVDANGQLGTLTSSRRFKDDIRDMADTTNNLFRLRPVTFRYKQALGDGSHPLQYGLVAEEVAAVYPELVQYDPKTGEPNSVMFQYLTPMLLNEVQKEHAQIESLEQQIQALKKQLTALAAHTSQR
jgi:hypothetical protein